MAPGRIRDGDGGPPVISIALVVLAALVFVSASADGWLR